MQHILEVCTLCRCHETAQVGSPIMCFHLWSLIFTMTLIQVHIQLPWLRKNCPSYWNEGMLQAFVQVGSSVSLKCNVHIRWKMYNNQGGPPKATNMNFHFGSLIPWKLFKMPFKGSKRHSKVQNIFKWCDLHIIRDVSSWLITWWVVLPK